MVRKIFVITFVVIVIVIAIVYIKSELRPFKRIYFSNDINIYNHSESLRADTISYILAKKILKFDTLNIFIYNMPENLLKSKLKYSGITEKIKYRDHSYRIFLKKNQSTLKLKLVLSHEFIHIFQYENKLLSVYDDFILYKNDTIDLKNIKYLDRAFEKDAFKYQVPISKYLNKILY